LWVEHLDSMDHLRKGIGLQGYGQRDPLVEYKRESYRMFSVLQASMDRQVAGAIFKIQIAQDLAKQEAAMQMRGRNVMQLSGPAKEGDGDSTVPNATASDSKKFDKVGRNDPCPCGSGKKFKKCHGIE